MAEDHDCLRSAATCGKCQRMWCHVCDPGPSALCPFCHGRGYSIREIRIGSWPNDQPRLHTWTAEWDFYSTDPEVAMRAFREASLVLEGEGVEYRLRLLDGMGEVVLAFGSADPL